MIREGAMGDARTALHAKWRPWGKWLLGRQVWPASCLPISERQVVVYQIRTAPLYVIGCDREVSITPSIVTTC